MSDRVFSAAILSATFGLATTAAQAGTMRVNMDASVTVQPQVTLTSAYMVVRSYMYTKGAPFDQLLAEAHGTNTKVLSLGSIEAGTTSTASTTMVASTYSPASYVGQPASATGLDLGVLIIGTYGTGNTLSGDNGVMIGYEPIAGNAIIQAQAAWNGGNIPMFAPTSTTAGTVALTDNFQTEANLFATLRTGTPAQIEAALLDATYKLSQPYNDDPGDVGIGIPYYSYLDTTTSPSSAARYHRNQKFVNRPAKLVKYSPAANGGDATINVSDPLPNLMGDFDGDNLLGTADIDLMLRGAAVSGAGTRLYDVNEDNQTNLIPNTPGSDVDVWVRTLKATEYGDASLDGKVNFDDLLALAQNYGRTTAVGWREGDFNGTSSVTFDDLLVLAQHYGFGDGIREGLTAPGSGDFATDWALARSLVPEPALFSSAAALLLIGRRRR